MATTGVLMRWDSGFETQDMSAAGIECNATIFLILSLPTLLLCGFFCSAINANVTLSFGGRAEWNNPVQMLTRTNNLTLLLKQGCLTGLDGRCGQPLSVCHSCYCGGLAAATGNHSTDADWLTAAKKDCAVYVSSLDVKSIALR